MATSSSDLERAARSHARRGRGLLDEGVVRRQGEREETYRRAVMMEGIAGILERRKQKAVSHRPDLPRILHQNGTTTTPPSVSAALDTTLLDKINADLQAKERIIHAFHTQVMSATIALGGMVQDDLLTLVAHKMEHLKDVEKEAEVLSHGFREFFRILGARDLDGVRPVDFLATLIRQCEELLASGKIPDAEAFGDILDHVRQMNNGLRVYLQKINTPVLTQQYDSPYQPPVHHQQPPPVQQRKLDNGYHNEHDQERHPQQGKNRSGGSH